MSKSNHQKYGFVVVPKSSKRDKAWIPAKRFIRENKKWAIWNGKPVGSLFLDEVGRAESFQFIDEGDRTIVLALQKELTAGFQNRILRLLTTPS